MRLIDADALINKLDEMISEAILADTEIHYAIIRELVAEQPTIKPEVRHGWWIEETEPDENGNVISMCNQCYHTDEHGKNIKVPYCWYCGAKMDEVSEDAGTD